MFCVTVINVIAIYGFYGIINVVESTKWKHTYDGCIEFVYEFTDFTEFTEFIDCILYSLLGQYCNYLQRGLSVGNESLFHESLLCELSPLLYMLM